MSFGKPYEMPTNAELEDVLKKNLDHTKPLEIKEYSNDGKKMLFPFWTPVKNEYDKYEDFKGYLDAKSKALDIKKKKDNVGVVQPKDSTKNYEDRSLFDKINSLVEKHNKTDLQDKSGAVKPKQPEKMKDTKKTEKVTELDMTNKVVVNGNEKSKTGVGAVKVPKSDVKPDNKSRINFDKYKTDQIKSTSYKK